jgi:NAD(P)-dependent dehydrogenase (short-subunit alcohol dehydrogenase family)
VALVTGAGTGIGRAIAVGLAGAGLRVGVVGRRREPLDETAAACRAAAHPDGGTEGGRGEVVVAPADVTDAGQVAGALAEVEQAIGPVDLLVSNAARVDHGEVPLAAADPGDVWDVVTVNLRGPLLLAHAVLTGMLARGGGRILHVNSGFASRRGTAYTGYAVSKSALARLTVLLDAQYAGSGIVVLDVSPGLVRTDLTVAMPMWADRPEPTWGSEEPMVAAAVRLARGDLDVLHGRFVHAQADDLDALIARAGRLVADDTRVQRVLPYGPDDPMPG